MNLRWHLSHARGYLQLGMIREARRELEAIPPPHDEEREVLAMRVAIFHQAEDWTGLRRLARRLVRQQPEEPGWWVSLAFATRRLVSIEQARDILLSAEHRHPGVAIIQFNLACYAAQLGELSEARARLKRAFSLEAELRELARQDPDLEPLRKADPGFCA